MSTGKHIEIGSVAKSVPYDNSSTGLGTGDVQSAIDSLNSTVNSGAFNLTASATSSTSTSSNSYTTLNSMSLTPTVGGNYLVIFTAQYNAVSGTGIFTSLFLNGVQSVVTERITQGPAGNHNLIMTTHSIINVPANQTVDVRWKVDGNSVTSTGRVLTLVKVQ